MKTSIQNWLKNANQFWLTSYMALCSFCLYSCVYGFRKAFSAATFADLSWLGIDYKIWLVVLQIVGYAVSKFVGIKVIAELQSSHRSRNIKVLVAIAGISWFLFAVCPRPYNIVFLFTNGIPLGMIWGMVFNYLEGRRTTDILGSTLSISFIFSSGLAKTVGGLVMRDWGTSEFWMPFVTSCLFTIPLLFFLWLLEMTPPPSETDKAQRSERKPMMYTARRQFIKEFMPGIFLFVLAYILLTLLRDFRDNFSAEIWLELGEEKSPLLFTQTEIPISILIVVFMSLFALIRNNITAFLLNHLLITGGMILIGFSTYLFEASLLSPFHWMLLSGLGLYMSYVPFNSIFFDRMLASFKIAGTAGFIMYVADAFGYTGSLAMFFLKEFFSSAADWLPFFIKICYGVSIVGALLIILSMIYFQRKQMSVEVPLQTGN